MTVVIDRLATGHPAPVMPSGCQSGGCGCATPKAEPQLGIREVRVNGRTIEPEAIAREMQHHEAPSPAAAWHSAASALVIRELLIEESRRRGIAARPESDELGRMECEEDALISELLETAIVPDNPSEEECQRYFQARQDRFMSPELLEAAHILIEPKSESAENWEQARRLAVQILARVGQSESEFALAAREYSACPSATQDGSLGQIRKGDLLPAVYDVLERLQHHMTAAEPVRTVHGWHVVRLHRRILGKQLPYQAVREKIMDALAARSWSRAATCFVAELASRASIDGVVIEQEWSAV